MIGRSWTAAWLGVLGVLCLATSSRVLGQAAAQGSGVSLENLIEMALGHAPELKLTATDVQAASAGAMAAAEPFDSFIGITASGTQAHEFSPPNAPPSTTLTRGWSASAIWTKHFRNGLILAPQVGVSTERIFQQPQLDVVQATADVKVIAPLLRDRGGAVTAAPERAARLERDAAALDFESARNEVVLQTTAAYWTYVAAERTLAVLAAAEERARRTVEDTSALVKADERTGSDLIQAQGYHSAARAARVGGQQNWLDAARRLAIVAGVSWSAPTALPHALSDFPSALLLPDEGVVVRWASEAIRLRPDLAALDRRLRGADILRTAGADELSARLDLEVGVGYTGQMRGQGGDLHRDVPGPRADVGLIYQLPVERTGRRGRLAEKAASVARLKVEREEIERQIYLRVLTAFETVKNSQVQLREAGEAVKLIDKTVVNEKKKFQMGSSTLFSVNQAEGALTGALLAAIAGQQQFAVALATLRFETGTLAQPSAESHGQVEIREVSRRLNSVPE
jgi:outer membrane protein